MHRWRGGAATLAARTVAAGHIAARLARRVPPPWAYVIGLFLGAKLLLTVLGLLVLHAWDGIPGAPPADEALMWAQQRDISGHRWISFWFAWDSLLYLRLTELPLTGPWRDFGFPLLYPFLARPVGALLGGDTALALLLISNVAFLLALWYGYRLAELLLGDTDSARRFTRYLVLLPTAFLFQAALTESLFVCLALAAFYHAERSRWLLVGVIGYFLAMSRSVGLLVALPLALVLLRQHDWRLGPRALLGYLRIGWPLLLLPAGWFTFMAYCRWRGGDWFAYQHAQETGWGIRVQNPLPVLWHGLVGEPRDAARVWFAVAVLVVLAAGFRRRELPYLVYGVLMVLVPLSMGPAVYKSLLRYLLAAFPVALVLARWARHAGVDVWLTATLAVVQGVLFVLWLSYWTHIII
ncbi:mannosyltransferase family protein [Micromonospora sp. WMMD967]|uniref:mannosyltransferase family protein n=1 Tax=Micromonospora sp. WMMD967 TaxID=3016101 RepID=UPI0024169D77|nr:mannosyltransferase family protein [Micromonospora sp. WMMD967]MDG4839611.1 mannosyltransferase family protein [Micromonospora sp. WMMD967]